VAAWALDADDQYVYYWAGAGALWLGDDRWAAQLAARARRAQLSCCLVRGTPRRRS
jgi:hypothetical protein